MNPAFLLDEGELAAVFRGWTALHYREGRPADASHARRTAELVARKPLTPRSTRGWAIGES
jgi:hypothetical protein